MIQRMLAWAALALAALPAGAQTFSVASPDGNTTWTVQVSGHIMVGLTHKGKTLLEPNSEIDVRPDSAARRMGIPGAAWWSRAKFTKRREDRWIYPLVPVKFAAIEDHFNEGTLYFPRAGITLVVRAYDNGAAYRWITDRQGDYHIWSEGANLHFHDKDSAWYPLEDGFYSHNERIFKHVEMDSLGPNDLGSLPALFDEGGTKVLFTEADLFDFPGLWLRGGGNGTINTVHPRYPRTMRETSTRDRKVLDREDFDALAHGRKELPWRVFAIADRDGDLLTNTLVYQLSRATTQDFSWVRPGKVSWDWWNDNNVYDVDFRAGINTATYEYYIDFAAKYGLPYIILDEGWSPVGDITKVVPEINMDSLTAYARARNVGLILWVSWLSLDKQLDQALDLYSRWGIKGIKVDFMQRDDQIMVNYYERVAKATADHHMLVDFHGAFKPTGLDRLYPNTLTREGVFGNENSKWSDPRDPRDIGPEHNVTLPFTRMVCGPMDYTPGAMQNAQKQDFAAIYRNPMSKGTRCQQLAMYVVYESPLQMLCDNPTHYYKEPECMDFLQTVPVTWDTTVVLQAKVGDYVAVARRAANGDWYVGAMTNWTPRDLSLDLSFLPAGNWRMDSWQDGINADRNAEDFKRIQGQSVSAAQVVTVHLAPGGGWAARITGK